MKNGRINERNIGSITLEGEPKRRRTKYAKMTPEEVEFAKEILQKVFLCMEYDPQLSERGHLHPESIWTDGGRFLLSLTGEKKNLLFDLIHERSWK